MIKPFYIFLLFSLVSCQAQNRKYFNYDRALTDILKSYRFSEEKISVSIDKSDYKLALKIDTNILKEYPVVFGYNALDDKLMQGDGCTPEGIFKMISKYPHKKWSKFIWINYPNKASWEKHNQAKKEGNIPKDAQIGGQVGIHGVPKGLDYLIDLKYNWTLGCISMKNKDVDEIYPYITKFTIIEIGK